LHLPWGASVDIWPNYGCLARVAMGWNAESGGVRHVRSADTFLPQLQQLSLPAPLRFEPGVKRPQRRFKDSKIHASWLTLSLPIIIAIRLSP
jgi:hypothetical protein